MNDLAHVSERLHLFADKTRLRLLCLLQAQELTVAELTSVLQLSQSRVSTHLGKLRDAGMLRDRRVATSTYYRARDGAPEGHGRLWSLLRAELDDAVLRSDAERADAVLRAREGGRPWPDAIAGEMERHYSPGRTWEATARAFTQLIRLGDVLDLGSGDGTIAQLLAPCARSLVCLDRSPRVVEAARRRLAHADNVRCLTADMHTLPFAAQAFDQVLLYNALTYAQRPQQVVREVCRVLRDGGQLNLVTLDAHSHLDVTSAYGHQQPGFAPLTLRSMLLEAGLRVDRCEVTSRERRAPYFQVVTATAHKAQANA